MTDTPTPTKTRKPVRKGAPPTPTETLGALTASPKGDVAPAVQPKPAKPARAKAAPKVARAKAAPKAAPKAAASKPVQIKSSEPKPTEVKSAEPKSAASKSAASEVSKHARKPASERTKPLNFRVTNEFRKAFKQAAATEDCKKVELLERLFDAWKSTRP